MSDEYEVLNSQIGDMGAEPKELGKLQHMPGQQDKLTNEEEDSKAAFLNRSRLKSSHVDLDADNDIRNGWIPIDRAEMGIRSQFYPEDWEFRIKPAEVQAIKNWSSIDEDNLAVTNNVFNEIMKACVSIKTSAGKLPWSKVNSWDRFWFILKIREYTFVRGESELNYEENCSECGYNMIYNLKSENLVYEFPDEEIIDKHWNSFARMWEIDPNEYGIDYPIQKLYIPTLEKDDAILTWAYGQQQQGKSLDEPFLRFLPWLLQKAPKDANILDKMIKECKKAFTDWDIELFSFMDEVLRNITINPSEKLKQICPNCGEEVVTSVQFPNGIKSIFAVENKFRKFGSK